jgi:hypothetical protein
MRAIEGRPAGEDAADASGSAPRAAPAAA